MSMPHLTNSPDSKTGRSSIFDVRWTDQLAEIVVRLMGRNGIQLVRCIRCGVTCQSAGLFSKSFASRSLMCGSRGRPARAVSRDCDLLFWFSTNRVEVSPYVRYDYSTSTLIGENPG